MNEKKMNRQDKGFAKELISYFFANNKEEMLEMVQEDLTQFINENCALYLNENDKFIVENIAKNGCQNLDDDNSDCGYCPLRIFNNEKMSCQDIAKNLLKMTGGVVND